MYTQWVFLKGNLKFLKGELFRVEGPIKKTNFLILANKTTKMKKKKNKQRTNSSKGIKNQQDLKHYGLERYNKIE